MHVLQSQLRCFPLNPVISSVCHKTVRETGIILDYRWMDSFPSFLIHETFPSASSLHTHTHTQLIATSLLFSKVWNWIFNLVLSVVRLLVVGYFQACCIRKRSPPSVDNNAWLGWKLAAPLSVLSLSCCLNALAGL